MVRAKRNRVRVDAQARAKNVAVDSAVTRTRKQRATELERSPTRPCSATSVSRAGWHRTVSRSRPHHLLPSTVDCRLGPAPQSRSLRGARPCLTEPTLFRCTAYLRAIGKRPVDPSQRTHTRSEPGSEGRAYRAGRFPSQCTRWAWDRRESPQTVGTRIDHCPSNTREVRSGRPSWHFTQC